MPKIKPQEQDESYDGPDPQVYRKYTKQTKKKLWNMVQAGKKTNSVAKFLKIKTSTAKMMIKKINKDKKFQQEMNSKVISIKQTNQIKMEPPIQKQGTILKTQNNIQSQQQPILMFYPVYFYSVDMLNSKNY